MHDWPLYHQFSSGSQCSNKAEVGEPRTTTAGAESQHYLWALVKTGKEGQKQKRQKTFWSCKKDRLFLQLMHEETRHITSKQQSVPLGVATTPAGLASSSRSTAYITYFHLTVKRNRLHLLLKSAGNEPKIIILHMWPSLWEHMFKATLSETVPHS